MYTILQYIIVYQHCQDHIIKPPHRPPLPSFHHVLYFSWHVWAQVLTLFYLIYKIGWWLKFSWVLYLFVFVLGLYQVVLRDYPGICINQLEFCFIYIGKKDTRTLSFHDFLFHWQIVSLTYSIQFLFFWVFSKINNNPIIFLRF